VICLSRELDKTAIGMPEVVVPLSLGNLGLMIADPTIDKSALHSQIIHMYKWSARVSALLVTLLLSVKMTLRLKLAVCKK